MNIPWQVVTDRDREKSERDGEKNISNFLGPLGIFETVEEVYGIDVDP